MLPTMFAFGRSQIGRPWAVSDPPRSFVWRPDPELPYCTGPADVRDRWSSMTRSAVLRRPGLMAPFAGGVYCQMACQMACQLARSSLTPPLEGGLLLPNEGQMEQRLLTPPLGAKDVATKGVRFRTGVGVIRPALQERD